MKNKALITLFSVLTLIVTACSSSKSGSPDVGADSQVELVLPESPEATGDEGAAGDDNAKPVIFIPNEDWAGHDDDTLGSDGFFDREAPEKPYVETKSELEALKDSVQQKCQCEVKFGYFLKTENKTNAKFAKQAVVVLQLLEGLLDSEQFPVGLYPVIRINKAKISDRNFVTFDESIKAKDRFDYGLQIYYTDTEILQRYLVYHPLSNESSEDEENVLMVNKSLASRLNDITQSKVTYNYKVVNAVEVNWGLEFLIKYAESSPEKRSSIKSLGNIRIANLNSKISSGTMLNVRSMQKAKLTNYLNNTQKREKKILNLKNKIAMLNDELKPKIIYIPGLASIDLAYRMVDELHSFINQDAQNKKKVNKLKSITFAAGSGLKKKKLHVNAWSNGDDNEKFIAFQQQLEQL